MITILSAVLGALYGGFTAKKRNGSRFDIAQYAAVYGVLFGLIGLAVTVTVLRIVS